MDGQKSHFTIWRWCRVFPVTKETSLPDLVLIVVKSDIDVNLSFSKMSFQSRLSSDFACEESLIFVCFPFSSEQLEVFSSFLLFFLFVSLSFPSLLAKGTVLNETESSSPCRMWLFFFCRVMREFTVWTAEISHMLVYLQIQKTNKQYTHSLFVFTCLIVCAREETDSISLCVKK